MKIKKNMKTYILFWNPAISSYKLDDFQEKLGELENNDLNWSVWEHEKVSCGDRFFMVRCGEGEKQPCQRVVDREHGIGAGADGTAGADARGI